MSLRTWLLIALLVLVPRLVEVWSESAYLHPDALHQALEPAFRLVWGYGEVSWEFDQGLRSYLWPGILAAPMAAVRALGVYGEGIGMAPAIAATRGLVAILDTGGALLWVGVALRHHGRAAALATGWLCATQPLAFVPGAQPLIEIPAAFALAAACALVDVGSRSRALACGFALGCTLGLRAQLTPAVLAVGLVRCVGVAGGRVRILPGWAAMGSGALFALTLCGLLDALTWGRMWGSMVAYLEFHASGGGDAFGVMPPVFYARHAAAAVPWLWPAFSVLALLGARRAPWIALLVLAIVLPHLVVSNKALRFLQPGVAPTLLLAAVGAVQVLRACQARRRWLGNAVLGVLATSSGLGGFAAWRTDAVWTTTWLWHLGGAEAVARSRGLHRAYLELSRRQAVGGILQAVLPRAAAPGYALLGHRVPVVHAIDEPPTPAAAAALAVWIAPVDKAAEISAAAPGRVLTWPTRTQVHRRTQIHGHSRSQSQAAIYEEVAP